LDRERRGKEDIPDKDNPDKPKKYLIPLGVVALGCSEERIKGLNGGTCGRSLFRQ